jgi:hypothetical protein
MYPARRYVRADPWITGCDRREAFSANQSSSRTSGASDEALKYRASDGLAPI